MFEEYNVHVWCMYHGSATCLLMLPLSTLNGAKSFDAMRHICAVPSASNIAVLHCRVPLHMYKVDARTTTATTATLLTVGDELLTVSGPSTLTQSNAKVSFLASQC